jgi:hypothetical protein
MAAITWRNIALPNFSGVSKQGALGLDTASQAAESIGSGLDTISTDRINTFDKILGRNTSELEAQIQQQGNKEDLNKLMQSQLFTKQGLSDRYAKHAPDLEKLLKSGTARERAIEKDFTADEAHTKAKQTAADSEGVAKYYSALANAQNPEQLAKARQDIQDNIYGTSAEGLTDVVRRSNARESAITNESRAATNFRNAQTTFANTETDRNSRLNAGTLTSEAFATRDAAISTQREQLAANAEKHDVVDRYDALGNAVFAPEPNREEFAARWQADPVNQNKNLPADVAQTEMNKAFDLENEDYINAKEFALTDRLQTVLPLESNKQFTATLNKAFAGAGVQAADADAARLRTTQQFATRQGLTVPALEKQADTVYKATAEHDSKVAVAKGERDRILRDNPVTQQLSEQEKTEKVSDGIESALQLAPKAGWTEQFGVGGQDLVDLVQDMEAEKITIAGEEYDLPGWALTRAVKRLVIDGKDSALWHFDASTNPEAFKRAIRAEMKLNLNDIKAQAVRDSAETSYLDTSARAGQRLYSQTQTAKNAAKADSVSLYGGAAESNAATLARGVRNGQ